ncbi:hypothetical protein HF1_06220 [Mycoplasma haemofelis str. Langford 1]|uniref:Uncharacterized protein n=1 Tax=Mycoplasma haemofelis (strain Langford 1) TaxID=941640 RepID=E8ZHK9_MYCHL|nr:hypothetical protein [Mycoplasma haemofelis]CBY92630.1 hypothetical protein HF1_06220 [Mycoplasma haemofelis str. Langford 1]
MSDKASLFPSNLRTGLLTGSAALASIGTSSSLLLDVHKDKLKTIVEQAGTAASPVVEPIKTGVSHLTTELDNFAKKGHNAGIDAKEWVTGNFNKAKIKHGADKIYANLKSGYEAVSSFAKEAGSTIKNFFEKWEDNRETMHIIFKSIGNSFSILGGLINSSSAGESKIKILFEVLAHEKFKDFAGAVSSLTSKNPNLFSQLQGDDIYDVLTAFRQEPDEVTGILKELGTKPDNSIGRTELIQALKLQSLIGKATDLAKKVQQLISSNPAEAKKLKDQVEKTIRELEAIIKSQESQEQQ